VSIKTDRDYAIGVRQKMQQQQQRTAAVQVATAVREPPRPESRAETDAEPVSRVPIVKSVELKKPYAEQLLQTAGPALALSEAIKAQAKLSNGYGSAGYYRGAGNNGCVAAATRLEPAGRDDDEKRATAAAACDGGSESSSSYTFGKPTSRPRKPREISPNVQLADPRQGLLESIRKFGGRDNLRKIRG